MTKYLNDLSWKAVIIQMPEKTEYITNFMMHDNIHFEKFRANIKIAEASKYDLMFNGSLFEGLNITHSMKFFKDFKNRPLIWQPMLYAAYPDVGKWIIDNIEELEDCRPFNIDFDIDDTIEIYRLFRLYIDYYIKNVNNELECGLDRIGVYYK